MAGLLDPTDDIVSPEERQKIKQEALFSGLLQGGLQLLAAGDNLYPWQRAQMLGQVGQTIGQMPGNIREGMQNAAQQKLLQQKYNEKKQQAAADAELMKIGENPAFLDTLKQMPPDMQSVIPALFKSGRARDAVTLVDNWRTNQQREQAAQAQANKLPIGWERAPDGSLSPVRGGPADPEYLQRVAETKRQAKDIPATITKAMGENLSGMQKIDSAMQLLDKTPDAIGGWGSLAQYISPEWGGKFNNEVTDPKGLPARAIITDIGSLKIHDRSGAAVTISETPRLKPFIPSINDSAATAKAKLENLKAEYQNMLAAQNEYYSPDNGFKPYQPAQRYFEGQQAPAPAQASPQQGGAPQAGDPLEGRTATGPNGQKIIRRNGQWVPLQ